MAFTDTIRAADGDTERGETAWLLACNARDADDWRNLAEMLDVTGTDPGWTIARCCRVTLVAARLGEDFSANRLRQVVPRRAWDLIPGTLKALALYGFIRSGQQTERSTAPGSRGWRVALYQLTAAGAELRAELAPVPRPEDSWLAGADFGKGVPGKERHLEEASPI